jgi:hypothetical protein
MDFSHCSTEIAKTVDEKFLELQENGYCVLKTHLPREIIDACKQAFWPVLLKYITDRHEPNRGPHRYFVPMPFDPPCYAPAFFFDSTLLQILRGAMDDRIVADQWGCDTPVGGSTYQKFHADYQRPLFPRGARSAITDVHAPRQFRSGRHKRR